MKLILIFSILFPIWCYAEISLPSCYDVNLHEMPVGFRCDMRGNYGTSLIWKRVNLNNSSEAWQRERDNTVWVLNILSDNALTQSEALTNCAQSGMKLPSTRDILLDKYGWPYEDFQRILSISGGHYWTSSKGPSGKPIYYNGWGGGLHEFEPFNIPPENVICVSK